MKTRDKNYFNYKADDLLDELISLHKQIKMTKMKEETKKRLQQHIQQAQNALIELSSILAEL